MFCLSSQRQEPHLSLWAGAHLSGWHTDSSFLLFLCIEFYRGGGRQRKSTSPNKSQRGNIRKCSGYNMNKRINERKFENHNIRLFSQDKEPVRGRVNGCPSEVLRSHLGPHNKGPGLRVQGLHQHLQSVRFLHSGTGTIIGLHGRQLSKEEC